LTCLFGSKMIIEGVQDKVRKGEHSF